MTPWRNRTVAMIHALLALTICFHLNGYIVLSLSQAHLHWANGLLVAHWHPQNIVLPDLPEEGDVPVAQHSHPLSNVLDLINSENGKYVPGSPITIELQDDPEQIILPCKIDVDHSDIILSDKSSRAPPVVSA